MTFLHPYYLHALWVLPVLLLLRLWSGSRAARATDGFVARRLRQQLVAGASPWRTWGMFLLQLLALTCFVAAIARPRWGEERRQITETGKSVLLAIDTSRSMLADDVKPNRLLRAKLAAEDIMGTLHSHRVGLVAFAGKAYLQAPLTTDHDAVIESIHSLDTNSVPHGGTTISEAIKEALSAFEKMPGHNHGLILFSDGGEEDEGLEKALEEAREKKLVILSVGVGTKEGSPIPDPEAGAAHFIMDPATHAPVHTRLEEATLQKIAAATGGRYLQLGSQALNASVVAEVLSSLESIESGNREEVKPIERFSWPLTLGIVALVTALLLRPTIRLPRLRPAFAVFAGLLLVAQVPANAAVFDSFTAQEALDAYKAKDYTRARDLYSRLLEKNSSSSPTYAYGMGAASHQLHEYDRAVEGFSQALKSSDEAMQARAHQGLGTALYEKGLKDMQLRPEAARKAWTDSLEHFEDATRLSNDTALAENRDHVKKQLALLKAQMEKKDKEGKKNGHGDKQKGEKQKGQEGEQEDEGDGQGKKPDDKGDQKMNTPKDGQQKDGKENEDGKGEGQPMDKQGEDKQGKSADATPEGKIQAGEAGRELQKAAEQASAADAEDKKERETGYSRLEARNLLRTYDDQATVVNKQRRERSVAKDW